MGKKRREREVREMQEKKRRFTINAIILGIAFCIVGFIVFAAAYDPNKPAYTVKTLQIDKNEDGSLSVPKSELSSRLLQIDFGYEQYFLAIVDETGTVRTAYDTCQECYASGNTRYALKGSSELVCSACGNAVSLFELGKNSWGGCQPVSIPPEYRHDSESEVVFSKELLAYAEEMFSQWKDSNYEQSMEHYEY